MRNKRVLAEFILDEYNKNWDEEDKSYNFTKEKIVDILVKFEEEVEKLPFNNRSNDDKGGLDE